MADRDLIKAELQNLQKVLEAKADMCIGAGKMKMLSFANACSGALGLLKEQEPKPVLSPHIYRFCMKGFAEYIAYCPNCKQEILKKRNKSYCGFCGQAVKWDE